MSFRNNQWNQNAGDDGKNNDRKSNRKNNRNFNKWKNHGNQGGRNCNQMHQRRNMDFNNSNTNASSWNRSFPSDDGRRNDGSLNMDRHPSMHAGPRVPPQSNNWEQTGRPFSHNKWSNDWYKNNQNPFGNNLNRPYSSNNYDNFIDFTSDYTDRRNINVPFRSSTVIDDGIQDNVDLQLNKDNTTMSASSENLNIHEINTEVEEQANNGLCTNSIFPNTSSDQTNNTQFTNKTSAMSITQLVARQNKERSAEEVTKKLIDQLTSMDKHNLKQMINNPNSKYDTVLQTQARKKIRAEMRKQLRNMSYDQENQLLQNVLEPDECIDSDKIPEAVFEEIGRVLDINLLGNDFQEDHDDNDENSSVVLDQNLGYKEDKEFNKLICPDDIFLRAEQLLMENSSFFLEERLNDSSVINSRSNSPIVSQLHNEELLSETRIKSESQYEVDKIKTEIDNTSLNEKTDVLTESLQEKDHFLDILNATSEHNTSLPNLGNLSILASQDLESVDDKLSSVPLLLRPNQEIFPIDAISIKKENEVEINTNQQNNEKIINMVQINDDIDNNVEKCSMKVEFKISPLKKDVLMIGKMPDMRLSKMCKNDANNQDITKNNPSVLLTSQNDCNISTDKSTKSKDKSAKNKDIFNFEKNCNMNTNETKSESDYSKITGSITNKYTESSKQNSYAKRVKSSKIEKNILKTRGSSEENLRTKIVDKSIPTLHVSDKHICESIKNAASEFLSQEKSKLLNADKKNLSVPISAENILNNVDANKKITNICVMSLGTLFTKSENPYQLSSKVITQILPAITTDNSKITDVKPKKKSKLSVNNKNSKTEHSVEIVDKKLEKTNKNVEPTFPIPDNSLQNINSEHIDWPVSSNLELNKIITSANENQTTDNEIVDLNSPVMVATTIDNAPREANNSIFTNKISHASSSSPDMSKITEQLPKKTDLITKLRNLTEIKSSVKSKPAKDNKKKVKDYSYRKNSEKMGKHSSSKRKSTEYNSNKKRKKPSKEKHFFSRKEKHLKRNTTKKNKSNRSRHSSSSSSSGRRYSSTSSSSSSSSYSSDECRNSSLRDSKSRKRKKSNSLKKVVIDKKNPESNTSFSQNIDILPADVNIDTTLVCKNIEPAAKNNLNITDALSNIYNTCMEKLENLKDVPPENTDRIKNSDSNSYRDDDMDDKERLRATLAALKTEGDDEECKQIIENIEQLIEEGFPSKKQCIDDTNEVQKLTNNLKRFCKDNDVESLTANDEDNKSVDSVVCEEKQKTYTTPINQYINAEVTNNSIYNDAFIKSPRENLIEVPEFKIKNNSDSTQTVLDVFKSQVTEKSYMTEEKQTIIELTMYSDQNKNLIETDLACVNNKNKFVELDATEIDLDKAENKLEPSNKSNSKISEAEKIGLNRDNILSLDKEVDSQRSTINSEEYQNTFVKVIDKKIQVATEISTKDTSNDNNANDKIIHEANNSVKLDFHKTGNKKFANKTATDPLLTIEPTIVKEQVSSQHLIAYDGSSKTITTISNTTESTDPTEITQPKILIRNFKTDVLHNISESAVEKPIFEIFEHSKEDSNSLDVVILSDNKKPDECHVITDLSNSISSTATNVLKMENIAVQCDETVKKFKIFQKASEIVEPTRDLQLKETIKPDSTIDNCNDKNILTNVAETLIIKDKKEKKISLHHSKEKSTSKIHHKSTHKKSNHKDRRDHGHNSKKPDVKSYDNRQKDVDERNSSRKKESSKGKNENSTTSNSNDSLQNKTVIGVQQQQPQKIPRLWRSPGEKKCIEPIISINSNVNHHVTLSSFTSGDGRKESNSSKKSRDNSNEKKRDTSTDRKKILSPTLLNTNAETPQSSQSALTATNYSAPPFLSHSTKSIMQNPLITLNNSVSINMLPTSINSMVGISLTEPLKLVTESQQHGVSDSVLHRMKDIDLKLMELQQNKMAIDEMMLKLQKDKMSIDQMTMQLQNERFLLLGTLISNTSGNQGILSYHQQKSTPQSTNYQSHLMQQHQQQLQKHQEHIFYAGNQEQQQQITPIKKTNVHEKLSVVCSSRDSSVERKVVSSTDRSAAKTESPKKKKDIHESVTKYNKDLDKTKRSKKETQIKLDKQQEFITEGVNCTMSRKRNLSSSNSNYNDDSTPPSKKKQKLTSNQEHTEICVKNKKENTSKSMHNKSKSVINTESVNETFHDATISHTMKHIDGNRKNVDVAEVNKSTKEVRLMKEKSVKAKMREKKISDRNEEIINEHRTNKKSRNRGKNLDELKHVEAKDKINILESTNEIVSKHKLLKNNREEILENHNSFQNTNDDHVPDSQLLKTVSPIENVVKNLFAGENKTKRILKRKNELSQPAKRITRKTSSLEKQSALSNVIYDISTDSNSSDFDSQLIQQKNNTNNNNNKHQSDISANTSTTSITRNDSPIASTSTIDAYDSFNPVKQAKITHKNCKIVLTRININDFLPKIKEDEEKCSNSEVIENAFVGFDNKHTENYIENRNLQLYIDNKLSEIDTNYQNYDKFNLANICFDSTNLVTEPEVVADIAECAPDSSEFDGRFFGHKLPIVYMQAIEDYVIVSSEDGNLYKYELKTGKLDQTFTQHTKTVTWFVIVDKIFIYSVSLDGFLKTFHLENFQSQLLSVEVGEPLQVIEYNWDTAFIGSRTGKIFVYDKKTEKLNDNILCSVGKSIMALKAAKEGPRNILIVSSRSNNINVRDAITGLLLRSIEVPYKITIYSILLDGGIIHCGTNQNSILSYEFTSGAEIGRKKVGIGTICVKMYKGSIIMCGCYDGFIYAYDKSNGTSLNRIQGPGKMLLHFDIVDDKIICASKDNKSLVIWNIPDDIVSYGTS